VRHLMSCEVTSNGYPRRRRRRERQARKTWTSDGVILPIENASLCHGMVQFAMEFADLFGLAVDDEVQSRRFKNHYPFKILYRLSNC